MAWNGSGTFTRTKDWTNDRDAAIKILATRHDENDDELATGIQACLTKNNETKPTADFRPNADNTYDLGSSALRWVDAWLSGVVKFGQGTYSGTLQADTLAADRTYTLPDESGTLLTSNSAVLPVGTVVDYAGASAPTGWLLCYGQAVDRTTYSALFDVIGETYGVGDGSTTFNLPDFRGRASFGKDDMGGSAASRVTNAVSGITGTTLGATGGSQLLHQHTHTVTDPGHTHAGSYWRSDLSPVGVTYSFPSNQNVGGITSATTGVTINNTGSGSSQNMPPAIIISKIIKT